MGQPCRRLKRAAPKRALTPDKLAAVGTILFGAGSPATILRSNKSVSIQAISERTYNKCQTGQEDAPSLEGPAESFACGDCDSIFASLEHLQGHRKRMHERTEGRHRCGHCPYSSDKKQHLLEHERTHTGERPFLCGTCGKAFTQQGNLTRHQNVHTGERPHECAECGQKFAQPADLRRHESTHSGERPHVCPECGRGFVERGHLSRHRQTHSGEKPYACHLCCYRASDLSSVTRHLIGAHSKEYPHKCGDCGKGFLSPGELGSHMRRQHACGDQKQ
ncbi:gastrula zinc finger protein XlCGF17.1-like [Ixodes scapularis]|uniref:gastrula zinc finger protein XlCGF17.1-like n=1 Tax=Ixodes scapularis TaxID=6945 RepID=UPI001C386A0A|nr:gastrula zinc finger protein XlCGF17.1-like [Ixodes scapularis]